jgi:ribosomal subunit interface protein
MTQAIVTRSPMEGVSMAKSSSSVLNVRVTGKQMETGSALRTRIEDELGGAIGKYFENGGDAEVVVSKDRFGVCVDIIVRLSIGQQMNAKASGGDAHSAFSLALDKLETRVRRYKRRIRNHHPHNGGPRGPAETAPLIVLRGDEAGDSDDDWLVDETQPGGPPASMVIAETRAEIRSQSVAMAVMELDLSDAPVVLFRNVAHGGLSVVYRRPDGNIGWIDPARTTAKPTGQAVGAA